MGLFKYFIMLFSLINAFNLFYYFIDNTLYLYLDIFYTVYIYNIYNRLLKMNSICYMVRYLILINTGN